MKQHTSSQAGFTLVEMIVAVALFAVVMLISIGALLSLNTANRKAQALQSVMNNLNIALDDMVRNIRMGTDFNGSVSCSGNDDSSPNDCTGGTTEFSFEPYGSGSTGEPWIYTYNPSTKTIYKSENGGPPIAITAPEVQINSMEFYVVGTTPGDAIQPKVIIVIEGTAGAAQVAVSTTFHIQATAVQRSLDLTTQ